MSAPRVKLHPDGRVVVRALYALARPWLAVSSADEGGIYLDIEAFSDEAVRDWPEYRPPQLGELVDGWSTGTVPTSCYDENGNWLWGQSSGGVGG